MRVFITKEFARYARRESIKDGQLREAVRRIQHGIIDAELGDGLVKQRLARTGQGRRGGFRILMAFQPGRRAVFIYGFAKNERANIQPDELVFWRKVASAFIRMDEAGLDTMLDEGEIKQVDYDEEG